MSTDLVEGVMSVLNESEEPVSTDSLEYMFDASEEEISSVLGELMIDGRIIETAELEYQPTDSIEAPESNTSYTNSGISIKNSEVVLVWKIPSIDTFPEDGGKAFHDHGVFPAGELMAVCDSYASAENRIDSLKQSSSMDGYEFATSVRGIVSD